MIHTNAVVMGVSDYGNLSLGQWAVICRGWAKAHGTGSDAPPTAEEFERAQMRVRGVQD